MNLTMVVYFRDLRPNAIIPGCTGNPVAVNADVLDGYYRDQFSLDANNTDLFFPGEVNSGGGPTPESQAVPGLVSGGIIPSGTPYITRLSADLESKVEIPSFAIAVSDEIAHAPLRQVQYQESYWSFPYNYGGITGNASFLMAEVLGWAPQVEET